MKEKPKAKSAELEYKGCGFVKHSVCWVITHHMSINYCDFIKTANGFQCF